MASKTHEIKHVWFLLKKVKKNQNDWYSLVVILGHSKLVLKNLEKLKLLAWHFQFAPLQIIFSVWSKVVPDMIKQTDNQKQTPPPEKLWSSILNENSCDDVASQSINNLNQNNKHKSVTFYFRVYNKNLRIRIDSFHRLTISIACFVSKTLDCSFTYLWLFTMSLL